MELNQTDREMVKDITRLGVRTAVLLRGVMLQKVGRETLEWGLTELAPGDVMDRHFHRLVDRPDWVYLLNLLHIIVSLEGQLDFQIREYGFDSLKDDLQEINFSLQMIGEQFDLEGLRETV